MNSFQWYDGITWTRGNASIKAGADIRRVRSDAFLATRQNNSYTFDGEFTGDGFGDFLLGIPSRIQPGSEAQRPCPVPAHADGVLPFGRLESELEANAEYRSAL